MQFLPFLSAKGLLSAVFIHLDCCLEAKQPLRSWHCWQSTSTSYVWLTEPQTTAHYKCTQSMKNPHRGALINEVTLQSKQSQCKSRTAFCWSLCFTRRFWNWIIAECVLPTLWARWNICPTAELVHTASKEPIHWETRGGCKEPTYSESWLATSGCCFHDGTFAFPQSRLN